MGVEYYLYAPNENVIYDVGKMGNWEIFKPYLTHKHANWLLIHENDFDWYPSFDESEGWPKEQSYTVFINTSSEHVEVTYRIPADVMKVDCFTDDFRQEMQRFEEYQRIENEKYERRKKEDEAYNKLSSDEKKDNIESILKMIRESPE